MSDSIGSGCAELEPYALRVTDDSMAPEFWEGCIIIIEPRHSAQSGQYAVVDYADDTTFRQFVEEDGRRYLKPLNEKYAAVEITGPFTVRGIVIQRAGTRRKHHKHYEYA
ncbi:MAG TPA: S24 family peptidase [Acidiferrobacterales bacterium]|nr:S24 family peptidase [Acidiferrobacterales bacterium]